MSNKILILEDKEGDFKKVLGCFSDKSNVYPNSITSFKQLKSEFNKYKDSQESNDDEEINNRNLFFENLLKDKGYKTFIVDIALKGDSDKLGEDFIIYLTKSKYYKSEYKVIISSSKAVETVENENFNYLDKQDDLNYINDLKALLNNSTKSVKSHNKLLFFLSRRIQYAIHIMISLFFYITIIASSIYGGYKILSDMLVKNDPSIELKEFDTYGKGVEVVTISKDSLNKYFSKNFLERKQDSLPQSKTFQVFIKEKKYDESKTLKFVEHVFLYSIPIFILIGFFGYYKSDFRHTLFNRPKNKEILESSKNSIKLAKTLFLSSIMSYVIIKIIEELFLNLQKPSIPILVSYGVFLFLLMGYLLLSHKGEHIDKNGKH